jgi:hypothetical protein
VTTARSNTINRCFIGAYQGNIDQKNPTQRTYSAPIPREYYENLRNSTITNVQLSAIDQIISNQLASLPPSTHPPTNTSTQQQATTTTPLAARFNNEHFSDHHASNSNLLASNSSNTTESLTSGLSSESLLQFQKEERVQPVEATAAEAAFAFNLSRPKRVTNRPSSSVSFGSIERGNTTNKENSFNYQMNRPMSSMANSGSEMTNLEILDKSLGSSRKNVTFNKEIDVRIFNKNAKNSNIVDSYVLPLALVSSQNSNSNQQQQQTNGHEDSVDRFSPSDNQSSDQNYYGIVFF